VAEYNGQIIMQHNEQIAGKAQEQTHTIELNQRQVDLLARVLGYFEINMEFEETTRTWIDEQKVIAAMNPNTKREFDQLALSFKILSSFSK
jgi:uncharacterized protein YeeX (DUF496 family)